VEPKPAGVGAPNVGAWLEDEDVPKGPDVAAPNVVALLDGAAKERSSSKLPVLGVGAPKEGVDVGAPNAGVDDVAPDCPKPAADVDDEVDPKRGPVAETGKDAAPELEPKVKG
jgi:hypothetical protein